MQRETTLKDALYKPFDNVDSRPGRGGTYDYIKWQHVADRMNQVFGTYWSSQIVSEHILNNDSDIILRVKFLTLKRKKLFHKKDMVGLLLEMVKRPELLLKVRILKELRMLVKSGVLVYIYQRIM
jgi:hypothetical protein